MILITGAGGLIGRALSARLLNAGEHARLQGRSAENVASALYQLSVQANLEVVESDFAGADQSSYNRLVSGCNTIVHCAGLVHQREAPAAAYDAINFRATQMLANSAKSAGVDTFVFLSTSAVYGSGSFANVDESHAVSPDTPYAVSKLRCEQWLQETMPVPRVIVLRPSLVFGEGDRGNMLSLIKQINRGLYFHIGGNTAGKSVIYAGDMAAAVCACLTELPSGYHLFNVANPQPVGVVELADTIAACVGKGASVTLPRPVVQIGALLGGTLLGERSPLTPTKLAKLMTANTLNVERLVAATGFAPSFKLSEAITREIDWARKLLLLS